MNNELHWTEGGNGIANFDHPRETVLYACAIEQHGDPNLYIGDPMPPLADRNRYRALRRRVRMCDLSAFWRIFELLQAAQEAKR